MSLDNYSDYFLIKAINKEDININDLSYERRMKLMKVAFDVAEGKCILGDIDEVESRR